MSKKDMNSPEMRAANRRALAQDQLPQACWVCDEPVTNVAIFWLDNMRITVGACASHSPDFLVRVARINAAMQADPAAGSEKMLSLLNSELNQNLPPLHELRLSIGYVTKES